MRILFTILVALLAGCATIEESNQRTVDISVAGGELIFRGPLDEANVSTAIALAEQSSAPIHTLRITSDGGDVFSGMDFGYWIHRHQLKLIVEDICFSSCANYLFTARGREN